VSEANTPKVYCIYIYEGSFQTFSFPKKKKSKLFFLSSSKKVPSKRKEEEF
jgi:hypothetical protein